MRLQARAKVNLWLNVVGRRAGDGYHLIDSLVAFTDLADVLEAEPCDAGLTLRLDGPCAHALESGEGDNLVLTAARRLAEKAHVSARAALRLTKNIPVAAGLGGGSADAAAALHALAEVWHVALNDAELQELAAGLGADVPMCLGGRTACVSGAGERLRPAPALPSCAILLINPGVALPTAEVFAARAGAFSTVRPIERRWSDLAELVAALAARGNDLTEPAVGLRPVIAEMLELLRGSEGAAYAAMSGSGATCFALYATKAAAERAAHRVPAGWWRHAGVLASG